MPNSAVFDGPMQTEVREARIRFLRDVISPWQSSLGLHSALDLGCGVGYFSAMLRDMGFEVTAIDGREENIAEARQRHAGINFLVANAEDPGFSAIGKFDFVLCVGLLYHLENPLRVFRNLHDLTGKILVVESMAIRDDKPYLVMLDEDSLADQSLQGISCYPTEGALVKMAYRALFPFVYRFRKLPDQADFRAEIGRARIRTMLAMSTAPMESQLLELAKEPRLSHDLWNTDPTGMVRKIRRIQRKLKFVRDRKRS